MGLKHATLHNIYPFLGTVSFSFSNQINVFIGDDAVGKSHALKIFHVLLLSLKNCHTEDDLYGFILRYFPFPTQTSCPLVMDPSKQGTVILEGDFGSITFTFQSSPPFVNVSVPLPYAALPPLFFIPNRPALHLLTSSLENQDMLKRILPMDPLLDDLLSHFYHASSTDRDSLSSPPLLDFVQRLQGTFTYTPHQGYRLSMADGSFLPLYLLSSGNQRLLMLHLLFMHRVFHPYQLLFWDNPEVDLSPRLLIFLVSVLLDMVRQGMQLFITSHDYLLCVELSLLLESGQLPSDGLLFTCLARDADKHVVLEQNPLFDGLRINPILDEFLGHYERQHRFFMREDFPS